MWPAVCRTIITEVVFFTNEMSCCITDSTSCIHAMSVTVLAVEISFTLEIKCRMVAFLIWVLLCIHVIQTNLNSEFYYFAISWWMMGIKMQWWNEKLRIIDLYHLQSLFRQNWRKKRIFHTVYKEALHNPEKQIFHYVDDLQFDRCHIEISNNSYLGQGMFVKHRCPDGFKVQ